MIRTIDLGGGGRACYQYGSDKQRTRKRSIDNPQRTARSGRTASISAATSSIAATRRDPNDPVEEIESHHLFEGEQRVLLVDDVMTASDRHIHGRMA